MRAADIIQSARETAGIEAFDSESYREGLGITVDAVTANKHITRAGEAFLHQMFVGMLANRLKVADYARRHPEIVHGTISRPVIVMGLPRTGTTLTTQLLSSDPGRRSLLRWEVAHPIPPPKTATLKTDPRCLTMKAEDAKLLQAGHPSAHIQYEAPDGPTECIWVLSHDFKSLLVETFLASPDYASWILNSNLESAYSYHRLFLQVLQSKAPGVWSLKLPSHSLAIRVVFETYPDARVIWCHRDPFKSTASLCSLVVNVHNMILDGPDFEHLIRTYPKQLAEHVRRPMALQDELQKDPFYHLFYGDMMRDPIGEMRKLYAWLGDAFAPEAEAGMRAWLDANPQGKFGKHSYDLEKFGLSKAHLAPYFEDYLRRFDIEPEA